MIQEPTLNKSLSILLLSILALKKEDTVCSSPFLSIYFSFLHISNHINLLSFESYIFDIVPFKLIWSLYVISHLHSIKN